MSRLFEFLPQKHLLNAISAVPHGSLQYWSQTKSEKTRDRFHNGFVVKSLDINSEIWYNMRGFFYIWFYWTNKKGEHYVKF